MMKKVSRVLFQAVLAFVLFVATGTLRAADSDVERVLANMRADVLAGPSGDTAADSYLASMQEDGSWKEINYADRTRTGFDPSKHMERMNLFAQEGARAGWTSARGKTMTEALTKGLKYWFTVKPESDNWWHQTIGIPGILGPTLVLCADELPEDLRNTAYVSMREAGKTQEQRTGANRTWIANNNLMLGILTGDDALVKLAVNALSEEVCVTTAEGLQPDWSFHQHGPMLQTGNYGNSWLGTQLKQVRGLQGTKWAYPDEKVALLRGYLLEHSQWPLWGQWYDISACGRQMDGPGRAFDKARGLANHARDFSVVDPAHSNEFAAVYQRFIKKDTAAGPEGARFFWRSEYLIQRTPAWFASLKMSSARIKRVETTVNDENKLGLHLCDGVTWFRVRGDEQENLQVLLDWRRLPGVTGRDIPDPVTPKSKENYWNGSNTFVGGVAKGCTATIAMDFKREPVTAKKVWFFRPWGMVALGADVRDAEGGPTFTGVNQMFMRGELSVWNPDRMSVSNAAQGAVKAVWHDGIGYLFPSRQDLRLSVEQVSRKWTDLKTTGTKDIGSGTVVRMHLAHQEGMSGTYEYAVFPSPTGDGVASRFQSPGWSTITNEPSLQAIADLSDGSISAVFWKEGKFKFGEWEIAVDVPCVLMLDAKGEELTLSVADPAQKLNQIHLTVSGSWKGTAVNKKLTIDLPQGGMAGSTVTLNLSSK
jgi:chondroitin AC lyase